MEGSRGEVSCDDRGEWVLEGPCQVYTPSSASPEQVVTSVGHGKRPVGPITARRPLSPTGSRNKGCGRPWLVSSLGRGTDCVVRSLASVSGVSFGRRTPRPSTSGNPSPRRNRLGRPEDFLFSGATTTDVGGDGRLIWIDTRKVGDGPDPE